MLGNIFLQNKIRIGISYALLICEFFVFAMMPFLMGKAVDNLIAKDSGAFYWYAIASGFALILGFVRRRFDNRAFLTIWAGKAIEVITGMMRRQVDSTKIVSRSYMVREYAVFLEFTIPMFISGFMEITVSLVMLWLFLPHVGFWVLVMSLAAILSCYIWSIFLMKQEVICQYTREDINKAITENNASEVETGYRLQRNQYVHLADLDACSWAVVDILGTLSVVVVILGSVAEGSTAGVIMANLAYANKLFEKAGFISMFFKHYKQLQAYNDFLDQNSTL